MLFCPLFAQSSHSSCSHPFALQNLKGVKVTLKIQLILSFMSVKLAHFTDIYLFVFFAAYNISAHLPQRKQKINICFKFYWAPSSHAQAQTLTLIKSSSDLDNYYYYCYHYCCCFYYYYYYYYYYYRKCTFCERETTFLYALSSVNAYLYHILVHAHFRPYHTKRTNINQIHGKSKCNVYNCT